MDLLLSFSVLIFVYYTCIHTPHTLTHTHWTDYKNGIQLYSSHDAKAMFQCNCDSSDDRVKLLRTLEATISEVRDTHLYLYLCMHHAYTVRNTMGIYLLIYCIYHTYCHSDILYMMPTVILYT